MLRKRSNTIKQGQPFWNLFYVLVETRQQDQNNDQSKNARQLKDNRLASTGALIEMLHR